MREVVLKKESPVGNRSTRLIEVICKEGWLRVAVSLHTPGWAPSLWHATTDERLAALDEASRLLRAHPPGANVRLVCPTCEGDGKMAARVSPGNTAVTLKCVTCDGDGEVSPERREWLRRGRELGRQRLARQESLSKLASRLGLPGVGIVELSDIENGRWNRVAPDLLAAALARL